VNDEDQQLHPNLARLAAAYDNIVERYARAEIDPRQARAEIAGLVARDDEGVLWSIDPDTAKWKYRDRSGDVHVGQPPAYGYPSPSPFQISQPAKSRGHDPDHRVSMQPVDEQLIYPPQALIGSTRRFGPGETAPKTSWASLTWLKIAIPVLAILLVLVIVFDGGKKQTPAPTPANPAASTTTAPQAPIPTAVPG
jgi:hypothetical protein